MKTVGRFLIGIVYFITIVLVAIGICIYTIVMVSANYLKKGMSLSDTISMFIALPIVTIRIVICDIVWFCMKRMWSWILTGTVRKVEA